MDQMKGPVLYPLDITKCDRRMMKAVKTMIAKTSKAKRKMATTTIRLEYLSFQKLQKADFVNFSFNNSTPSNVTGTQAREWK